MKKLLKVQPTFKEYIWGGTSLKDNFGFETDLETISEVWILTGDKEDSNKLVDVDSNLYDYVEKYGDKFMGTKYAGFSEFPILIKIIGAAQNLSIQVHPDDAYANKIGQPYGKTEMWHILDTKPNNDIFYGPKVEMTKAEFEASIKDNTIEDKLATPAIKPGDNIFLKAGTIHAIKADTTVFEVQQKSNTTYRIYDFDRTDASGNKRDLHIQESLDVSDLTPMKCDFTRTSRKFDGYTSTVLESCDYFSVTKYEVDDKIKFSLDEKSFASVVFFEGTGTISVGDEQYAFKKGDSFLLPANTQDCLINGKSTFAISTM